MKQNTQKNNNNKNPKPEWPNATGRERFYFCLQFFGHNPLSLTEVKAGTQGATFRQELKQRPWRNTV